MDIKRALILLILGILLIPAVCSIGIGPALTRINFEPNYQQSFDFRVINSINKSIVAVINVTGPEEIYYKIEPERVPLYGHETKMFTLTIRCPDRLKTPGINDIQIVATEERSDPEYSFTAVKASIISHIFIRNPYPGKYLEITSFEAKEGIEKPLDIRLELANYGEETIDHISGFIDVYDITQNETLVTTIETTGQDGFASFEKRYVYARWDDYSIPKGQYKLVATINYDGLKTTKEYLFRVGEFKVSVTDHTKEIKNYELNEFFVEVENERNQEVSDIYAVIKLRKPDQSKPFKEITTPVIQRIPPFSKQRTTTYIDAKDVQAGEYVIEIYLMLAGRVENTYTGKIKVIGKEGEIAIRPAELIMEPFDETEQESFFSSAVTKTNLLIGFIILLVILNIIWFVRSRKKGGEA